MLDYTVDVYAFKKKEWLRNNPDKDHRQRYNRFKNFVEAYEAAHPEVLDPAEIAIRRSRSKGVTVK